MGTIADENIDRQREGEPAGGAVTDSPIRQMLVRELGPSMADAFTRAHAIQELRERELHPKEGLRERKKRLLRQQISDVATTLFVVRGFEHVTVAEIADIVGVSEKTVYNHFPTKESLVFDRAEEGIARVVRALREREPGESPTKAMLRALGEEPDAPEDSAGFPEEIQWFIPMFAEMVASTPALRAAWLDLRGRLVEVANEELAARADVDPREPEPTIAAWAIVGLQELSFVSRVRHIERGLRGNELRDAVREDLERAARLLDAGLWSFNLLTQGARTRQQLSDAAAAAEEARKQVVSALKQARSAWRELRKRERTDLHAQSRGLTAEERRAAKRVAARAGEAAWKAARQSRRSLGDAHATADQAAYEAFRQMLRERHEAVRARQAQEPPPR
jgi:AcrR family transcriptional regulator